MSKSRSAIPIFESIDQYNFKINISPPRYPDFDIRDFEENMKTVKLEMSPFRIPFYQVALLESGGGVVSADGQEYNLDNFTLFFNLPGQIIYWRVPQNWKGFYLCLEESFYSVQVEGFRRLQDLPFFKNYTPAIKLNPDEAKMILEIMSRMNQEYTNPTAYNKSVIKSYLSTVLAYCIRFFSRQSEEKINRFAKSSIGDRFKDLVHEQLSALVLNLSTSELSVQYCADQLAITAKHLSESIRQELGVTPTDYINSQLIAEAKKLLLNTDLQVKEIAYQLGFNDPAYFNRLFKKLTDISPAKFRQSTQP